MSEVTRYVATRTLPTASDWNSSTVPYTYVRAADYDALLAEIGLMKETLVGVKKSLEHELQVAGIDDETYCCVDTDDMYGYIQTIEKVLKGEQP